MFVIYWQVCCSQHPLPFNDVPKYPHSIYIDLDVYNVIITEFIFDGEHTSQTRCYISKVIVNHNTLSFRSINSHITIVNTISTRDGFSTVLSTNNNARQIKLLKKMIVFDRLQYERVSVEKNRFLNHRRPSRWTGRRRFHYQSQNAVDVLWACK